LERDPNTSHLSVTLECSSTFRPGHLLEVTVKVTYEAQATARQVTFHTVIFEDDRNYQLGRLRSWAWANYDDEDAQCGFRIMDDPDVPINVGQDNHFTSLQPGESWMTTQRMGYNWTELPTDAANEEAFRYVFTC
jgi:hypothetical protein